jgi:Kef-type K+ transport system membrane component KefB
VSFETLLVIVLAGLGGPLLALGGGTRTFVPVVIGEIVAGVIVGRTGLEAVNPADGTVSFLGQVGFAMLMLTVGMHLPLRERRLLSSLRQGALLAAIVGVLAIPAGLAAAAVAGTAHAAVYAVVLASGSAAVLLPALEEVDVYPPGVLAVMAQVTIADVVTIVAVPIVLAPSRAEHAALGGALVAAVAALLLVGTRLLGEHGWIHQVRKLSKQRHWALDLRLSLLVLFLLAWIAQESGTSVLVAGFGAGVTVALIGGPKRLSTQMRGLADGFFIPLYFIVLGAQLDLSGLVHNGSMLALAAILMVLNIAIHLVAAVATGRRPSVGLVASAQLGVPAAAASLGLADHVLSGTAATAIVTAALGSLLICTLGVGRLIEPVIEQGGGEAVVGAAPDAPTRSRATAG